MWSLVMYIATFGLHTASLHQVMRSTGYESPFKQDAPLWLVGFQQLWLSHFDPYWFCVLFPWRSAVVQLSCCCVSWLWASILDCDPHWYIRTVNQAIHIRLHPSNINRDSGIEIPEAWMPMIKKHNCYNIYRRTVRQRTIKGTTHRNNKDQKFMHQSQLLKSNQSQWSILLKRWHVNSRRHRLKTSSMQLKCCEFTSEVTTSRDKQEYLIIIVLHHDE